MAEQVGVNAPGKPKMTTFLPRVRSSTLNVLGPIVQPLPSTSMYSDSVPDGSLSPTLIVMETPLSASWKASTTGLQARKKISSLRLAGAIAKR